MSIDKILSLPLNRREFLKRLGTSSLALPFLIKCAGDEPEPTPNPGGYTPQVNFPPYFETEYFLEEGETNEMGVVWAYTDSGFRNIFCRNEKGESIKGLETIFYEDDISGEGMFFITDPEKKYMPNIDVSPLFGTSSKENLSKNSLIQSSSGPWNFVTMHFKEGFRAGGNIFVQEIEESLPSWNPENVCTLPGFIYLGDWSFNQLKRLNTNLNRSSVIISVVAPNLITPEIAAVLSGIGTVLDGIDFAIDGFNFLFPSLNIDKDKEYPMYQPPIGGPPGMILSLTSYNYCKNYEEDIKYLFPTEIGNSWTFKSGWNTYTSEIEGIKKINGRYLLVNRSTSGVREYIGFLRDTLCYYGIGDPDIGDILFDPPLKLGDNKVGVGKTYQTVSKIIAKNYPDISGSVDELISYVDRETVVVSNTPYGDCFKMREDFDLHMSGDGGFVSESETFHHWYAKNVGKVKQTYQGETAELVSAVINNQNSPQTFSTLSRESSLQLPSVSQKIVEGIKRVI